MHREGSIRWALHSSFQRWTGRLMGGLEILSSCLALAAWLFNDYPPPTDIAYPPPGAQGRPHALLMRGGSQQGEVSMHLGMPRRRSFLALSLF